MPQTRAMKRQLEQLDQEVMGNANARSIHCSKKKKKNANATGINDLPTEMQVEIFEYLSLRELVDNYSRTCLEWRRVIAQFILGPNIFRLANDNGQFKRVINELGWTEEAQESDFILSLYPKYQFFSSEVYSSK